MWCKAEFSASLLQSSVSHDPSEIWICWFSAKETILIIINVVNSFVALYICGNHDIKKYIEKEFYIWNINIF